MVALLHPDTVPARATARRGERPPLRLVRGGLDDRPAPRTALAAAATTTPVVVAVAAVMALVLMAVGVRAVQGGPPADSWVELAPSASPATPASTHLVVAGDTWFSVATRHLPALETDEAVRRLIEANGGFDLVIGAELIIPDLAG